MRILKEIVFMKLVQLEICIMHAFKDTKHN